MVLKRERLETKTTLIASRRSLDSYLLCDSARLKLHQFISGLWRPCPQTLALAERLRTRIDVEWPPATKLLETVVAIESSEGHTSEPHAETRDSQSSHLPSISVADIGLANIAGGAHANQSMP